MPGPMLAVTLGLAPAAYIARLTRSSVLDVMNRAYITAALAKGVGWGRLALRHVLKNSILPVVTLFGPLFADLLTGSFVVEYIFTFPGLGLLTINAIFQRDFPIVQAISILAGSVLVVVNMLVDFVCTTIDRRLQL